MIHEVDILSGGSETDKYVRAPLVSCGRWVMNKELKFVESLVQGKVFYPLSLCKRWIHDRSCLGGVNDANN